MIQVNLIPDLKAQFLKAQRTKRVVMTLAGLVAAAFIGLTVMLFLYVNVAQKEHSDNLTEDINGLVAEFQSKQDLDKIVTIQKQLEALPLLHEQKPLISRLPQYLTAVTPEGVEFRSIDLNFETLLIKMTGRSDTVADANKFVNSLKNARYTVGEDIETELIPFTNIILSTLSSSDEGAVFEIDLTLDGQIFLNSEEVKLGVPEINSTLSELESPDLDRQDELFDDTPVEDQ